MDRPTMVLCPSHTATTEEGRTQQATLRGGMRAWKAQLSALEHP
jgi:hypothetical protein